MKKILLFIVCIIACTFVACSDDEKDAGEKAKESVANTSWFHYQGTDKYTIDFHSDGSVSLYSPYGATGKAKYTQHGTTITFYAAEYIAAYWVAELQTGTISYAGTSMDVKLQSPSPDFGNHSETWTFQLDLTK